MLGKLVSLFTDVFPDMQLIYVKSEERMTNRQSNNTNCPTYSTDHYVIT